MLLKNCNTRLFVHPLEWTADHLEALDVDLVISASTGELVADEIKRQVDESTPLLGAVWDLEHAKAISRDQQTRQLVKSTAHAAKLQHDVIESTLFFEYNKRPVAQLPPLILASRQPTQEEYSGTPIWAYTDHMWTSAARRERYTARKKSWSFATKKIKSKQELIIDPIYIAILIALAQLRSRHDPQGSKLHRVCQPFLMLGSSNISMTGYSFRSGARIEVETHYPSIEYHNPRIQKRPAPVKSNSHEACTIHSQYPIRLFAEVQRTL
jgi:hypothetical protein